VLHELSKVDPNSADAEDGNGWTALTWAMNPPGYPDNVTELLDSGIVGVNQKDRPDTPLISGKLWLLIDCMYTFVYERDPLRFRGCK
jgi:hypothetical protein